MAHHGTPGSRPRWFPLTIGLWGALLLCVLTGGAWLLYQQILPLVSMAGSGHPRAAPGQSVGGEIMPAGRPQQPELLQIDPPQAAPGQTIQLQGLVGEPDVNVRVEIYNEASTENAVHLGPYPAITDGMGRFSLEIALPPVLAVPELTVEATTPGGWVGRGTLKISGAGTTGSTPSPTAAIQPNPLTPTATGPVCTFTPTPTPSRTPTPTPSPTRTPWPTPTPYVPIPTAMPTTTPVPWCPTCPYWRAEYFNNVTFAGPPAVITNDPRIDFKWGQLAPVADVNRDWFAVRWTRRVILPESEYRFVLAADDWAELWIDGEQVATHNVGEERPTVIRRRLGGGEHSVEVHYIEYWGEALVYFYFEQVPVDHGEWHGVYFSDPELAGGGLSGDPWAFVFPIVGELHFDWGKTSPAPLSGIPADHFSAQWTRELNGSFKGRYRLCIYADDDLRLWVNEYLLVNEWDGPHPARLTCQEVTVADNKPVELYLAYMDDDGEALLGTYLDEAGLEGWIGAYFPNPDLQGLPDYIHNDPEINFNWGVGGPKADWLSDGFSVQWVQGTRLVRGEHRFEITTDDGIRFSINDQLMTDPREWDRQGTPRTLAVTYPVTADSAWVSLKLEYRELTGPAAVVLKQTSTIPTLTATLPPPTLCCVTPTATK